MILQYFYQSVIVSFLFTVYQATYTIAERSEAKDDLLKLSSFPSGTTRPIIRCDIKTTETFPLGPILHLHAHLINYAFYPLSLNTIDSSLGN